MNPNMTTTRHELIKQHIDSLPVLPVTVTRLMEVTSDPESSAQDVMESILPDQSLCLTILKIANSVLFGRPKKVDSIKMAVAVLGFNEVQRIALTKALINSFSKLANQHKLLIDRHWTHSFICGIAAKIIAQDLHLATDIAFMGGLIHDIGKLIMLETFSDDYAVEYWMTKLSDEEMLHEELQMFSFTHDLIGGQLLRKWCFPENLISVVENHHRPSEAIEAKGLAHIIQLADILSFYCCNHESLGGDDLLTAVHTFLPDIQSHWNGCDLLVGDDAIAGWFDWLSNNYEQGCNLKDAFST
jgi:putative nucleotidyltransferase with HDIG domain